MRAEDLSDAMGLLEDELVADAAKWGEKKRLGKRRFRVQSAAAVLAVFILAGVLAVLFGRTLYKPQEPEHMLTNDPTTAFGNDGAGLSGSNPAGAEKDYVLYQSEYPQMAKYPDEQAFIDKKTGEFDSVGFSAAYDAWSTSRRRQADQPDGYADGLSEFFAKSMREFLGSGGDKNVAYAPINVYMALGMLAEVTDKESRSQILALLDSRDMDALRSQAYSVWNANYCRDGAQTSVFANSLWLRDDMTYTDETLRNLTNHYYAFSFRGEMGSDGYNRRAQEWLLEQTGGLLDEQCREVAFEPETMLGLMSTVYFQAKWAHKFQKENTKEGIFHAGGADIVCDFMKQSEYASYYWGENFSAFAKEFDGGFGGKMWFILPDEGIRVDEVLAGDEVFSLCFATEAERCQEWTQKQYLKVNLSVPKFDISSEIDLRQGLKNLGVTAVFDAGAADFSPLTEERDDIFLSQAKHAVRVMVDEDGCAAAAYTVMLAAGGAMPPKEEVDFVLDRPFLFVITSNDGLPMFTGIVNQPAATN